MKLNNLRLVNFKNHLSSAWDFKKRINCFIGHNGSGKTNILDAIHYLSLTKSYFNSSDMLNLNFTADSFSIKGEFESQEISSEILCVFDKKPLKLFKKNGKKYKRFSDHIGSYPVIFISPTDINLINQSSDIRRRYVDMGIAQFDKSYLKNLINYNKTLKQRNSLLKHFSESGSFDEMSVNTYNEVLVGLGEKIYNDRKEYIDNLLPIFKHYYYKISQKDELVDIQYRSHLNDDKFLDLLEENISRDIKSHITSSGIHKDDFIFTLKDHSIKRHGSQGQQKSFVISLKLSQFDFIKNNIKISPILLLDDLFDKLDETRIKCLLQFVKERVFNQVFITDTNEIRTRGLMEEIGVDYNLFEIIDD